MPTHYFEFERYVDILTYVILTTDPVRFIDGFLTRFGKRGSYVHLEDYLPVLQSWLNSFSGRRQCNCFQKVRSFVYLCFVTCTSHPTVYSFLLQSSIFKLGYGRMTIFSSWIFYNATILEYGYDTHYCKEKTLDVQPI